MEKEKILEQLLALLQENDVTIRREPLGGAAGGLCTIKGQPIFFVDTQAPSAEIAALAAQAVLKTLDIETVYIRPQVRQFVELIAERNA